jgi:hypothetical protein
VTELEKKYLDHLPETAILNFESHYLPWFIATRHGLPYQPQPIVYQANTLMQLPLSEILFQKFHPQMQSFVPPLPNGNK